MKIGQRVTIPWWEFDQKNNKPKRVSNLRGKIIHIDGAYHYIKILRNKKYDIIELYPNEFEVLGK